MITELAPKDIARFTARFDKSDGCWTWTGDINNKGYGVLPVYRQNDRQRLLAHRIAYFLATGDDPAGRVVRHRCDNPPCVRPDHLEIGTQADNIRDAIERGRADLSGLALGRTASARRTRERIVADEKRCPSCGETKRLAEFHRNRSARDGRQASCTVCKNAAERAHRAALPKRPLVPCGTETAYRRHLKSGETPCEPCRRATRVAARERRRIRARRGIILETPATGIERHRAAAS